MCCCAEEIPFDLLSACLGTLGAGPSHYVLPHHKGQGFHWEVFKIYLKSISSSVLAWLICSSKTLLDESNLRKIWKMNIVIGIEDWLIWDEAEMESIKLQHSRIFISLLITEISMPTLSPKNIQTCLSLSRSFLSQLSCLHVILIYHVCHKISWSSLSVILEILYKGITDFGHLR